MSSAISSYFENAQLSFASYAVLQNTMSQEQYINSLINSAGMATQQAIDFSNTYKIIDQFTDTLSGFSATVFQNRETQEYTFAIRGTEDIIDIWYADILGIALDGSAQAQINAMNAYFGRLITPVEFGGQGLLDQDVVVNVAGHSLGGHLSTVFTLQWYNHVNHAYTYNGAGTGIGDLSAAMVQLIEILGLDPGTPLPNEKITNLYGEPGLEVTAGVGVLFGDVVPAFIEDQGVIPGNLLIGNHSILHLADALAIYNLLATIDSSLTISTGTVLLESVSNNTNNTLEELVNALGILFKTGTTITTGDRDQLYTRLSDINAALFDTNGTLKPNYQNLTITPLLQSDPANKFKVRALGLDLENPEDAIAYRYALVNLNPFVITGNNALYEDNHNQNSELDLYDETTGAGTLTEQYLDDRAKMLVARISLGIQDLTSELPQNRTGEIYQDKTTGVTIDNSFPELPIAGKTQYIFGRDIAGEIELLQGNDSVDHLYGQRGNDILIGGLGADYLEGGDGDDVLYSNDLARNDDGAKDILKGGKGKDAYYVGHQDEIEDSDRQVQFIEFNGITVDGVYVELAPDSGEYKNEANGLFLTVAGNDARIRHVAGSQVIFFTITNFKADGQGFNNGDYNITLLEETPPPPVQYTPTDNDDVLGVDEIGTTLEIYDGQGGPLLDTITFPTPLQSIEGLGGSDIIQIDADIPNLVVYGDSRGQNPELDGDDWIEIDRVRVGNIETAGDTTQGALLYGEGGHDFISGGQRDDFLYGGDGDDRIFGDKAAGSASQFTGGEDGNDYIDGGASFDRWSKAA